MKTKRVSQVTLLVSLLFVLAACANPKAVYVTTAMQFNDVWENYLDEYDKQDPATQARWKKDVDPKFILAADALDAWERAIVLGDISTDEKQAFKKAKNALLEALFEIYQSGGNVL